MGRRYVRSRSNKQARFELKISATTTEREPDPLGVALGGDGLPRQLGAASRDVTDKEHDQEPEQDHGRTSRLRPEEENRVY
jgi:hypothetical protein